MNKEVNKIIKLVDELNISELTQLLNKLNEEVIENKDKYGMAHSDDDLKQLYNLATEKSDETTHIQYEDFIKNKFGGWVNSVLLDGIEVATDANHFVKLVKDFYT